MGKQRGQVMQDDERYFERRAREERQRAKRCQQPEIRRIHAELAERYETMLPQAPAAQPA